MIYSDVCEKQLLMFNLLAHEFIFYTLVCPYCVKGTDRQTQNMPEPRSVFAVH
jgi:hypothetical protein